MYIEYHIYRRSTAKSFSRGNFASLKIKSKSTGNLYCFDSKPKGSFRFDMESLDFQFSENEHFFYMKPKHFQRGNEGIRYKVRPVHLYFVNIFLFSIFYIIRIIFFFNIMKEESIR